jgi:4-alpha-glucanotransferase
MAKEQLGFKELEDGPAAFVKATFDSVSRLCVIPMQDILGLDNSARMNTPSTIGGNWGWRMKELPDASIAERLLQLNKESERG